MNNTIDRTAFETMYARLAPWEVGKPQESFVSVADRVVGSVLDAGCGTGDIALFFAGRGHPVTGIDFLEEPIRRARQKAVERGLSATFLVRDALTLADWDERFDTVLDSGLFHVFSDEDRTKYVAGLAAVLRPYGLLFLMCWSDEEPGTDGPRRVARQELYDAFADGWHVESVQRCRVELRPTRPDLGEVPPPEGGAQGWFAVMRRVAPAAGGR